MRLRRVLLALLPGVVMLAFWEWASGRLVREIYVSRPSAVAVRLHEMFASGEIQPHLLVTLQELVLGYVIGVSGGVLAGYALGRAPRVAAVLEPYLMAFYGIPKIALAPLFIIWFGIAIWSKVALAAIMVFFLVFYSVYSGVRGVDQDMVNLARVMGANERQLSRHVYLPAAAPSVLLGMRMAIPYSVIGVIAGEFTSSVRGLGLFINQASATYDPAGVFAGITLLLGFVVGAGALAGMLERRLLRWRPPLPGAPTDLQKDPTMRLTRRTLIAAVAAAPALAQTRRRVRIGQATPAVSFLPVMAARAFGSFAAAGLDLDWAAIPGGDPTALAALDAGDIDLAAVGSETLLNAIARGQPFQIVASLMSKVSLELVASNRLLDRAGVTPSDPLTKRLGALRGAVVGVSAVGGTQDRAARWLARQGGIDPRTGLQVALAGPPPAIQAALEAGRIEAFVLSPPEGLQAEDAGTGRVLVRMGDEFEQLRGVPSLVLAVRTPVDEARRALVSATLKVLQEASAQVLADPAAAASRIQQALFPRIKPAIMAAAIDGLRSGLVNHGRLGPEGITSLLRYAGDVAGDLGSRAGDGGFWTNAYSDRPI